MRYVQRYPFCIYFLRQGDRRRLIKIGRTQHLNSRISYIRHSLGGRSVELLGTLEGGSELECTLHRRFAHLSVGYEWFRPASELSDYIRSHADQAEAEAARPSYRQAEKRSTAYQIPESLAFAVKLAAIRNGRSISEEVAARLSLTLGLSFDWLDEDEQPAPLCEEDLETVQRHFGRKPRPAPIAG